MVKGPLPDRLEFAILQIVMSFNGKRQNSWGEWSNAVSRMVPDLADGAELKAAFTRMLKHGHLRLTKWHVDAMCDVEYSGREQDDSAFFFTGNFNAIITDEGRSHWGKLNLPQRSGVFISHIAQEKPVALVLQEYLKLAFGDDFRVFVSSDAKSIGGGKKWYTHIIENLRMSEVVLVLVSQESQGRPWINFEAGVGEGVESRVIPISMKHGPIGQMPWPLAGLQARSIDNLGSLLDDIGDQVGLSASTIGIKSYLSDLENAESSLIYKSLKVEPAPDGPYLRFDIENVGNIDLELLMFECYVPSSVLQQQYHPGVGFDIAETSRNGVTYLSFCCYSNRGVCGNTAPILRPIITPSMGKVRPSIEIPIRTGLNAAERDLSIFFQIHVIGYRTEQEERQIKELPSWV